MQSQFGAPHIKPTFAKFVTLQNKAVKTITGTNWNGSANPSYKSLNILKLNEIYKLEVGKVMYLIQSKQYPHNISHNFTKVCHYHSRTTRSSTSSLLTLPLFRASNLQQSFLYQGVKIWNSISL